MYNESTFCLLLFHSLLKLSKNGNMFFVDSWKTKGSSHDSFLFKWVHVIVSGTDDIVFLISGTLVCKVVTGTRDSTCFSVHWKSFNSVTTMSQWHRNLTPINMDRVPDHSLNPIQFDPRVTVLEEILNVGQPLYSVYETLNSLVERPIFWLYVF